MNTDIFYAIPIVICIITSLYFFVRWILYYSGIKRIKMSKLIKEGMIGLSYINKNEPEFDTNDVKKLNRLRRNAYLFMILGIVIIILNQILNHL